MSPLWGTTGVSTESSWTIEADAFFTALMRLSLALVDFSQPAGGGGGGGGPTAPVANDDSRYSLTRVKRQPSLF